MFHIAHLVFNFPKLLEETVPREPCAESAIFYSKCQLTLPTHVKSEQNWEADRNSDLLLVKMRNGIATLEDIQQFFTSLHILFSIGFSNYVP